MNLRDSETERGAAGDDVHPGASPKPDHDESESTHVSPPIETPKGSAKQSLAPEKTSQILGVVIIYSEIHKSVVSTLDPRLGRVYPLREGEILFLGRPPAPAEVLLRNGESRPPTHCHLFPHGGIYGYISRWHLTVEMDQLGGAILTDYSRHGIYLQEAGKWHRLKDPSGPPDSHRVTGEERVILMDDLGEPTKRDLADRRSHYLLHILQSTRLKGRSSTAGTLS